MEVETKVKQIYKNAEKLYLKYHENEISDHLEEFYMF